MNSAPSLNGSRYDCVVIGGGHNGLVCATYLARGGRSVLVAEAAERVGGAAVTREVVSDFRVSACAHLLIDADKTEGLDSLSPADADAFPTYAALLRRLAESLQPVFETTPPRLGTDSWQDRFALARLGLRLRSLGRRDMRELLRIGGMCVQDLLDDYFETPLLKG